MIKGFKDKIPLICLTLISLLLILLASLKTYAVFSYQAPQKDVFIASTIDLPVIENLIPEKPVESFPHALPKAPNDLLIENTYEGYLPQTHEDLTPFDYYSAPFDTAAYQGIISTVVGPFELNDTSIYPKIDALPHQVSLVLSPYTYHLQKVIDYARQRGHEVYLTIPFESLTFPADDPGPDTLMVNYSKKTNLIQLNTILGKASGYVGLVNLDGGRFVAYETQMRFFLTIMKKRGLGFVDGSSNLRSLTSSIAQQLNTHTLRVKSDNIFQETSNADGVLNDLNKLAGFAKYNKNTIALFNADPITIETLIKWYASKPSEIDLAPLSTGFAFQKSHEQ